MASIDEAKVRAIVAEVLARMTAEEAAASPETTASTTSAAEPKPTVSKVRGHGVFETVDEAIEAAVASQRSLAQAGLEQRKQWIEAMRQTAREHARELAEMAVAETGIGRAEHKVLKNEAAANLTPGVEDLETEAVADETGLLVVERVPLGVINAITPTTNPTSTIINNAIIMVAAGNSVVFSPHPRAAECCKQTMVLLNDAVAAAGGPRNLLTCVAEPSLRTAKAIMEDDRIAAISATGGGGVVRAALSSGKKAWAAGPGNPPVVIDETADVDRAAQHVVEGASFDNDVLCIGEKSCFLVTAIADRAIRAMVQQGGYLLKPHELPLLMQLVADENGHPNVAWVGKDAAVILEAAGIRAPRETRVILVETSDDHPLVREEFLMPILPIVRVGSFEEAVEKARIAEGGNHHTAMLHTALMDRVRAYAQALQVGILVVNGPSYSCGGIGGPGFLAMTVAGRTGEGFTRPRHFTTERRVSLIGTLSFQAQGTS